MYEPGGRGHLTWSDRIFRMYEPGGRGHLTWSDRIFRIYEPGGRGHLTWSDRIFRMYEPGGRVHLTWSDRIFRMYEPGGRGHLTWSKRIFTMYEPEDYTRRDKGLYFSHVTSEEGKSSVKVRRNHHSIMSRLSKRNSIHSNTHHLQYTSTNDPPSTFMVSSVPLLDIHSDTGFY
ncbi:hypothetical protein J6590_089359 [Homalodisca vitripennis]|nr:hypothetical protein J6590_089359 [Homalodisca vitripennis]